MKPEEALGECKEENENPPWSVLVLMLILISSLTVELNTVKFIFVETLLLGDHYQRRQ